MESASAPAVDGSASVSGDAAELHVAFGTHHWRVRGADRNKTPDTLRVALAVTDADHGGFHLDTLDLCQAKARAAFIEAAVAELHTDRPGLVRELAEVLFATEAAVAARDAGGTGGGHDRRRTSRGHGAAGRPRRWPCG